jgi:hypothetical protein
MHATGSSWEIVMISAPGVDPALVVTRQSTLETGIARVRKSRSRWIHLRVAPIGDIQYLDVIYRMSDAVAVAGE